MWVPSACVCAGLCVGLCAPLKLDTDLTHAQTHTRAPEPHETTRPTKSAAADTSFVC